MNYIDLFHGIGGFALGAYWAGMKFENHLCSDIEPYCQKLYALRFPDSIQLGDITKIDTEKIKSKHPGEWIITGGFPCQDISIAGKGAGIAGVRSGLWFEYWRIIRDLRPRFAIMENVGMLVHRGLREVLGSLAEIGYDAEWQDIRASDMGAPHRRERIWIIAYPNGNGFQGCSCFNIGSKNESFPWCQTGRIFEKRIIANADSLHSSPGWKIGRMGRVKYIPENRYWKIASEPFICGGNYGASNRVDRLKGLGNAIVPQIAELLFKRIKYLLDEPRKASQS